MCIQWKSYLTHMHRVTQPCSHCNSMRSWTHLQQFLGHDMRVLHFHCHWDDTMTVVRPLFSPSFLLASFPGLPWLQFLIACSMQKLQAFSPLSPFPAPRHTGTGATLTNTIEILEQIPFNLGHELSCSPAQVKMIYNLFVKMSLQSLSNNIQ